MSRLILGVVAAAALVAMAVCLIRGLVWMWNDSPWMGLFCSGFVLFIAAVFASLFVEDN